MNFNFSGITKVAKAGALQALKFATKHKHVIAVTSAVAGYAYVAYDIYKNSPEVHERLDEETELKRLDDIDAELTPWEVICIVAPYAWKPIIVFATSTTILIFNERGHAKTVTALTATQQLLLRTIEDMEKSVVDEVGENKYNKIKNAAIEDRIEQLLEGREINEDDIHKTGHGDTLMIDMLTGQLVLSSMDYIERVEAELRALVSEYNCVSTNEYLERLHLNTTIWSDYMSFTKERGVKIETTSHRRPDGTYITGLVPSVDMTELLRYYKENYSPYDL